MIAEADAQTVTTYSTKEETKCISKSEKRTRAVDITQHWPLAVRILKLKLNSHHGCNFEKLSRLEKEFDVSISKQRTLEQMLSQFDRQIRQSAIDIAKNTSVQRGMFQYSRHIKVYHGW